MFLSIITVVFNGATTISRTIESILEQDFGDYEYIIQDGGSTDETKDIVDSYISKFKGRLRWYSEKDNGIYDAMNRGIQKAKGDYIWLVNSDDYIAADALQKLYEYFNSINFKTCVLSGRMNIIDSKTMQIIATTNESSYEVYKKKCQQLKMGICHPATIVHKDIYKQIGLYDERYYISADIDFCLRCFKHNIPVAFTSLLLTNMSNGGVSNQFPIRKNMHDCNIRASKFCRSLVHRVCFQCWYFVRLIALKFVGFRI